MDDFTDETWLWLTVPVPLDLGVHSWEGFHEMMGSRKRLKPSPQSGGGMAWPVTCQRSGKKIETLGTHD